MSLFRAKPAPVVDPLADAQAKSSDAVSLFTYVVDELADANAALHDVAAEAEAAISEHTARRDAAKAQVKANAALAERVNAIISPAA